ncbi:MAG: hypothetical protein ACXWBN_16145, partial [Acidimicrobiales bacterium]
AISLGIFLLIATVVSIAIGRSMSVTTAGRTDRVVTETLTGQLDKMSALDYANLLTGNFTVPDPCSGSVSGIAGQSCVRTTAGTIKVGYSFQSTGTGGPVDTVCDPNASPTRSNTDSGFVGLCANVVAINGQPAANLDLSEMSQSTSTRVNAPTPGYDVTKAMVRMTLAGSSTDVAALSGRSVFVSKAADPTQVVGSGVISGTTAYVNVPGSGGTACTATAPCVVALAPSTTPTMADGLALSSSLSAGPGQSTTTAAGLTTTLSGGAFTAAPGRVTDVAATVFRPGVASVNLLAADGSTSAANPIAGSVCLWATFPDGASKRTVPVCNTTTAGRLVLDTYNPTWDTNPASALRYPFPVGVPIQLSVDHPDGVCYYAPGMVAYQVAAATANTIANWPAVAQCTSYTWGEPTSGLDTPITLVSGQTVHRDVVWRSGAPFDAAAPAAGLSGRGSLWSSPRLSRECSLDATCSTTPAKALEWTHCRSQFCYGNGAGGEPVVVTPGTKVVPNPSSGAFGPYEIQVADPEGDAFTAAAGAAGAGTTDLRSWGLTWSTSSTGTYSSWPAAGATLLGTGSGTRSIFIKFTRPPADTTTASLGLDLSDNVAPVGTRSEVVTFVNSTDLTSLAVDDVTIAQGGSANTTVTATTLAGTAASGKTITVTGAPAGLTLSSPTTDATGTASLALNATGAVAAGTYQLTATSPAATPRTFNVTVKPAAGTISLTAAPGAQGTPGTLTAAVTDRAGNAMAGVVVSFKVVDASGATSNRVYPQNTGCSTAASGSCSVPVTTAADAPAGNYQAYASSGTAGVGPVTYTVAQTPTTATGIAGTTPRVVRGSSSTSLTVEVLDGAGAPVTGKSLTFGTDTVVTAWSPTSATTTAQGRATSTVTVAAAAPLGSRTFPVTVAGKTLQVPVVIADVTYSLTYPTIAFDQASTATFALTARDNNNAAVPATPITLTTNNPGLQVPASVTTDGSGVAQVPLTARAGLPAGQYTLTAVLAGTQFQIPVTVRQVLSSATVAGVVDQGKTFSSLVVTLLDASGTPVPATATTLAFPSAPNLVMNPPTGTTDSSGQVTVTVNDQGPTRAGLYPLTVSSGTFSTTVTVTVRATPTTLTVTPSQVDVANGGKVRVQASLTDAVGAPIPSMALSDTGFGTATFLPEALVANLPGSDLDTGAAVTSTGSVAYAQANSARDGYVAKVTGAGAATATLETSSRTPFDPTTLYRVTARVRVTTDATGGNRPVYLGVAARSSSGTLIPGNGTQHWAVQSTPATSDGWVTLTGYFQGYGTPGTSSDPAAPAALTAGTSTIAATLSLNNGAAGSGNAVWEVDYLQLDAVT